MGAGRAEDASPVHPSTPFTLLHPPTRPPLQEQLTERHKIPFPLIVDIAAAVTTTRHLAADAEVRGDEADDYAGYADMSVD